MNRMILARIVVVLFTILISSPLSAEKVQSGYLAGVDLRPLGSAPSGILGIEPAAIFVFAADSPDYDALSAFNSWYVQPHGFDYPIFAIGMVPSGFSTDVLEEVLFQREIKVPVFTTRSDLLEGERKRVLTLDRGQAVLIPESNATLLESRMNALAEAAGLIPKATLRPTSGTDLATSGTPTAARSSVYVNRRYGFNVRFPDRWQWTEAQNEDGALGNPPPGAPTLDLRVWATRNDEGPDGKSGSMTIPEYLNRHFALLGDAEQAQVNVERRFVVKDEELEGRDYTYSYTKANGENRGRTMRGRVQAFEVQGVFKVACAEGPAEDFSARKQMIEDFLLSFRPTGN